MSVIELADESMNSAEAENACYKAADESMDSAEA
jgi:hypothetical protein